MECIGYCFLCDDCGARLSGAWLLGYSSDQFSDCPILARSSFAWSVGDGVMFLSLVDNGPNGAFRNNLGVDHCDIGQQCCSTTYKHPVT